MQIINQNKVLQPPQGYFLVPCVVQGCKYHLSKSLLLQLTLHSVTVLISLMGRFCMVGTKRGSSLGSCMVERTLRLQHQALFS